MALKMAIKSAINLIKQEYVWEQSRRNVFQIKRDSHSKLIE